MKRLLIGGVLMLAFCLTFAGSAKADDIHLCGTPALCVSNPGYVQFTGSTGAYAFGKSTAGDTLYVAVLTPVADTSGTWNDNKVELWTLLGESPSQVFPNLNSAISQLEGGAANPPEPSTGFSAESFNIADFLIGAWPGASDTSPFSFTLPGSPSAGDMYIGFIEDSGGNLVAVSPWSSSLLYVPEPSSLMLLAVGLLGVLALSSKKVLTA